jgi:hypothetical protein
MRVLIDTNVLARLSEAAHHHQITTLEPTLVS